MANISVRLKRFLKMFLSNQFYRNIQLAVSRQANPLSAPALQKSESLAVLLNSAQPQPQASCLPSNSLFGEGSPLAPHPDASVGNDSASKLSKAAGHLSLKKLPPKKYDNS